MSAEWDDLRERTEAALAAVEASARAYALPEPPTELTAARIRLGAPTYRIAVIGEAKRGKSTFVNALIGQPVLPTDVAVATSQVFLVRQADREAYRLRFEDDSAREISREDLPRYGSQVVADAEGLPRLDQLIRWIEVDVPVRFLPPGVELLDTPGLGSLYAAHAQVTQRFIPHADAVIFVLDSGQPIGAPELGFVEHVLGVTRNILFVQTKLDLHRREHWETVQRRNEEVLRQRFGDRLRDVRVWPIGSRMLLRLAETGREAYRDVSLQESFAAALDDFLAGAIAVGRAAEAVYLAERYHASARTTAQARLQALGERSAAERERLRALADERRTAFDADWGPAGQKRRALLDGLRQAGADGKTRFVATIRRGGTIHSAFDAKVEAVPSIDEAERLGRDLASGVLPAAIDAWGREAGRIRARYLDLLEPFFSDAEALGWVLAVNPSRTDVPPPPDLAANWLRRIDRPWRAGDDPTALIAGSALQVLLAVGVIAPPVMAAGMAAAAVWVVARRWLIADKGHLRLARTELREHLAEVLDHIEKHFLVYPRAGDRLSLVDAYLDGLERSIAARIDDLAARKTQEALAEITRLTDQTHLDERSREAETARLREQLGRWDKLGETLRELAGDLAAARGN